MTDSLIAHLWQSTVFAGLAWALTMVLRRNGAHVRYWIWFSASLKFLIPFALLVQAGSLVQWHPAVSENQQSWIATAAQFGQPVLRFPEPAAPFPAERLGNGNDYLAGVVALVWFTGFLFVAALWLTRLARVRALIRSATAFPIGDCPIPVLSTAEPIEPGVFGVRKPVLLLPGEIVNHLTAPQLRAIIAHELCHVRRRDNLTAAIHMGVQAVFWFHPLVWWMGSRLLEERERACDEEVLRIGQKPRDYAEGILKVCRFYAELPVPWVAGVSGADLRKRIEQIMKGRSVPRLNLITKAALSLAAVVAVIVPLVIGILHLPSAFAQPAPNAAKWEVASIRSCKDFGQGQRGANKNFSPNRMTLYCYVLQSLIVAAYLQFPDGVEDRDPGLVLAPPVEGGPAWINSDRYTINAKADRDASPGMMQGPMLQSLLEDRFGLKAHFETKGDQPAYALTVAKSGPKLKPSQASCTWRENISATPQPGDCLRRNTFAGGKVVIDEQGITVDQFRYVYLRISPFNEIDGPVVDRTGLTGRYDVHLENVLSRPPSLRQAGDDLPDGPSLFTALQEQLGLKLERIKAPRKFLVIDQIERPSEN